MVLGIRVVVTVTMARGVFFDWACGTGKGGVGFEDDVQREVERHQVKGRGERKASGAVTAVRDGIEGVRKGRRSGKKGSGSD